MALQSTCAEVLVEAVAPGGSGAVAGLQEDDVIVGVNNLRLQHYVSFASQLSGRQREGMRLKLTVHRLRQASEPNKRQRKAHHEPGKQGFTGMRLGDGMRTHAERIAATFATGSAGRL